MKYTIKEHEKAWQVNIRQNESWECHSREVGLDLTKVKLAPRLEKITGYFANSGFRAWRHNMRITKNTIIGCVIEETEK